ncbi:uncharacterized protein [Nicotiana sylvestris]|uniref:uncharacterized protein n=1 Tax=Nicotiana sylvestris TaxID=4096 RepID=UPI00388CB130
MHHTSTASKEDTSKPGKGKKRKKDATVSTSTDVASHRSEDEGDNDGACPLVQRERQGEDALDAQDQDIAGSGAFHGGGDVLEDLLAGIDDDINLDSPGALEDAEKLQQQVKNMYEHAFSRLQCELSYCGKEVEKLASELKESRTSSARKGEELSRLQASLEGVCQERAGLAEQIGQKDAIVGRLQEEAATKDAEILELRGQNECDDPANQARRQAFEEASAKYADLSAKIEEARDLEEELAFSATSDEGSRDDSKSSDDEE